MQPSNIRAARRQFAQFLAAQTILLAAGDGAVLSTIREQKHLLHHRSHCRYRHRPQSAPLVLAQGLIYFTARKPLCARDWCGLQVCMFVHLSLSYVWIATGSEDTFVASKN